MRVVADQFGAPTSARVIADAVSGIIRTNRTLLANHFTAATGVVNVAASGETTWCEFASAIVNGLKARGIALAVENVVPIATKDYPTKARRPANSRLDLTRLRHVFGIDTPKWDQALAVELDRLAIELFH